jgi:ribosomal protein S18 acetylase RimI-like enzyme
MADPDTGQRPTVILRPVSADRFEAVVRASTAGYAEGIEVHGGRKRADAIAKAERDVAALLTAGAATPGHWLFDIEAGGEVVGRIWLADRASNGRRTIFVYDLDIAPAFRGRGFGRSAMHLAEGVARDHGIDRIELHVFGANEVARGLYRSLGYAETSIVMAKDLT